MSKEHHYKLQLDWTGNRGQGTASYTAYDRNYRISGPHKKALDASADPAFRGDTTKYNPEEMLLAALSSCHMLWYLHLCADNGVMVLAYSDAPEGKMVQTEGGGGHFESVTLRPTVTVSDVSMVDKANFLHSGAREKCFIANSVNFPVGHEVKCLVS